MKPFAAGTFGQVAWRHEYAGYQFCETRHPSGTRLPRHSHELASINVVLSGMYCEDFTQSPGLFDQYQLVFKPPGEVHSNHFHQSYARCLLIEFATERYLDLVEHLPWMRRSCHFSSTAIGPATHRLVTELDSDKTAKRISVESCILSLLLAMDEQESSAGTKIPGWLVRVEAFLRENRRVHFSLEDLSASFRVHKTHLARQFRRYYQSTLGDYVRHLRLQDAKSQLESTDLSIAQIAEDCGFSDQSHFGRWFKKAYGQAPGQFRRGIK